MQGNLIVTLKKFSPVVLDLVKKEPDVTPTKALKYVIDSSTFAKSEKHGLRLVTNFTFRISSHSVLNNNEGERVYILQCVCQDGRTFKVGTVNKKILIVLACVHKCCPTSSGRKVTLQQCFELNISSARME